MREGRGGLSLARVAVLPGAAVFAGVKNARLALAAGSAARSQRWSMTGDVRSEIGEGAHCRGVLGR